ALGAMLPTDTGSGLVITGVQAVPEVCVSVMLLMLAALAAPGPRLVRVMVDVRALLGPDLAVINPERPVGPAAKLAVTAIGPVRVAVVEAFAGSATGPVQP